jgi:hypothetical protein
MAAPTDNVTEGSGVRSYSSLLIILKLMLEVSHYELNHGVHSVPPYSKNQGAASKDAMDLRPCHYFDFIYGSSSGGYLNTPT